MKHQHDRQTLMYQEAGEAPLRGRQQLASNSLALEALGKFLRETPPAFIVTCARGSSGHAATYAKYLIETHTGIPTLSAAPSINSLFAVRQNHSSAPSGLLSTSSPHGHRMIN